MKGDGGDNRSTNHSAPISFISPYPHISFLYTAPCSDLLAAAMPRCGSREVTQVSRPPPGRSISPLTTQVKPVERAVLRKCLWLNQVFVDVGHPRNDGCWTTGLHDTPTVPRFSGERTSGRSPDHRRHAKRGPRLPVCIVRGLKTAPMQCMITCGVNGPIDNAVSRGRAFDE
jgi:hypothetical protein